MKISVITPFYKGNKYLSQYFECMINNKKELSEDDLEIILVNDSPEETMDISACDDLNVVTVNLPQNMGIHYARVEGLKNSTGEYVMFLDQDDLLENDALKLMAEKAKETQNDIVIANALLMQKEGGLPWYRTDYHKGLIWDKKTYLEIGNQIMSPGQCLIKKSAIPEEWTKNILKNNCCDDYYLWLLMIEKVSTSYIDKPLYIHSYTGSNVSGDMDLTYISTMEMIHYLRRDETLAVGDIDTLFDMTEYKYLFKLSGKVQKVILSLKNMKIALTNIKYKKKTATPYGFNRW